MGEGLRKIGARVQCPHCAQSFKDLRRHRCVKQSAPVPVSEPHPTPTAYPHAFRIGDIVRLTGDDGEPCEGMVNTLFEHVGLCYVLSDTLEFGETTLLESEMELVRRPATHDLKCWPAEYQAMLDYIKTFEIRRNDRNYQVGDGLHLREWVPDAEAYTGRESYWRVEYLASGWGLQEGYVCMTPYPIGEAHWKPESAEEMRSCNK